jgi:hypothetical protein
MNSTIKFIFLPTRRTAIFILLVVHALKEDRYLGKYVLIFYDLSTSKKSEQVNDLTSPPSHLFSFYFDHLHCSGVIHSISWTAYEKF